MFQGLPVAALSVAYSAVLVALVEARSADLIAYLGVGFAVIFLVRAYSRVTDRHDRVRLLDDFSRTLARAAVTETVVPALLVEAANLLHADRALLIVADSYGLTRVELDGTTTRTCDGRALDAALLESLDDAPLLLGQNHKLAAMMEAEGMSEAIATRLSTSDHDGLALMVAERSGAVRRFDKEDVTLFESLGVHAGLALQNRELVERLHAQVDSTEHMATHDSLTSLPNRLLFQRAVDATLEMKGPIAVLLLDLDRFKEVNDTLGHHNGDLLLVEVGQRISGCLGPDDLAARLGGDKSFVLAMADHDDGAATLVRAIADLGSNLGFSVVAEGVETRGVADELRLMRCLLAQGYHFARAMEVAAFDAWLAARDSADVGNPVPVKA